MHRLERLAIEYAKKYGFDSFIHSMKRKRMLENLMLLTMLGAVISLEVLALIVIVFEERDLMYFPICGIVIFSFAGIFISGASRFVMSAWNIQVSGFLFSRMMGILAIFFIIYTLTGLSLKEMENQSISFIAIMILTEAFILILLIITLKKGMGVDIYTFKYAHLPDKDCVIEYLKSVYFEEKSVTESILGKYIVYEHTLYKVIVIFSYYYQKNSGMIWIRSSSSEESVEYAFRVASELRKKCHVNE